MSLFDAASSSGEAALLPLRLDRAALSRQAQFGMLPPLVSDLVQLRGRRAKAGGGSLARRLAGIPEAEHESVVLDLVREHVAAVLGHSSAATVEPEASFKDLGFDSLGAVELRNRLGQATGARLVATLAFDYPTPLAVARHLLDLVEGSAASTVTVRAATGTDEPIAIVGGSCRYPGGVGSPQQLWELVASGRWGPERAERLLRDIESTGPMAPVG